MYKHDTTVFDLNWQTPSHSWPHRVDIIAVIHESLRLSRFLQPPPPPLFSDFQVAVVLARHYDDHWSTLIDQSSLQMQASTPTMRSYFYPTKVPSTFLSESSLLERCYLTSRALVMDPTRDPLCHFLRDMIVVPDRENPFASVFVGVQGDGLLKDSCSCAYLNLSACLMI